MIGTCRIKSCGRKDTIRKGLCSAHYNRLRVHGSIGRSPVKDTPPHGMNDTPEHVAWRHMRKRCNNPSHPKYKDYGGRGIKVCKR